MKAALVPGLYDQAMPFEQIGEAFALLARREAVKIVLALV